MPCAVLVLHVAAMHTCAAQVSSSQASEASTAPQAPGQAAQPAGQAAPPLEQLKLLWIACTGLWLRLWAFLKSVVSAIRNWAVQLQQNLQQTKLRELKV